MDDQREGIAHHIDDNLSDQQANYLLARFNARTDAVPSRREISAECKQAFAILQTERDWRPYVVLSKLLLQRANRGQSIVPTPFQLASNQPVVRIDFVILPMRADGLEPCLFKRILELSPLLQVLFRMGIHCGQGSLDTKWLQSI